MAGRPTGLPDTRLSSITPKQGKNLITSIDIDLQQAAEIALGERTGAAVALDIQSGEVLAIASHPTYDLNRLSPYIPRTTFQEINELGAWLNRSVQLSYPPGSTFKLITSIAGLRHGSITTHSQHDCGGVYRVGNRIFRCHSRWGHGATDLAKAVEGSCNVFYYAEGLEMGIDVLVPKQTLRPRPKDRHRIALRNQSPGSALKTVETRKDRCRLGTRRHRKYRHRPRFPTGYPLADGHRHRLHRTRRNAHQTHPAGPLPERKPCKSITAASRSA